MNSASKSCPGGSQRVVPQVQFHLMLHIQMQLCELSLWDWIVERNQRGREYVDEAACEYRAELRTLGRKRRHWPIFRCRDYLQVL